MHESFIFGKISDHGFHGFHGWETHRFLSVKSVKSVVAFVWLRLAALRLCVRKAWFPLFGTLAQHSVPSTPIGHIMSGLPRHLPAWFDRPDGVPDADAARTEDFRQHALAAVGHERPQAGGDAVHFVARRPGLVEEQQAVARSAAAINDDFFVMLVLLLRKQKPAANTARPVVAFVSHSPQ